MGPTVHRGLELIEIAPGTDLEKDILLHISFHPKIAPEVRRLDKRLFGQVPMNRRQDLSTKARCNASGRELRQVAGKGLC
jgi:acyl CoA:acetate/3-ketoacid CoA transferase